MNFDSFSHGQIVSKLWLCEELEPHIKTNSSVCILGGWHNVLGMLMLSRNEKKYKSITNVDIDADAINVADKITDKWRIDQTVSNVNADANSYQVTQDVVINCSVEHFSSQDWFDNIPKGTLVCIQTCDVTDSGYPWLIAMPNPDMETFLERFPLSEVLFTGEKDIVYPNFGYKRFMMIGIA